MDRYYLLNRRMNYSVITVPFCREYARKHTVARRIWIFGGIGLCALALTLGCLRWSGVAIWSVVGPLTLLAILPSLLRQPDKFIRISNAEGDFIEFEIANPDYARFFASLNAAEEDIRNPGSPTGHTSSRAAHDGETGSG